MLGAPLWYWALFLLAFVVLASVPLAYWWEERQDALDREAWELHQQQLTPTERLMSEKRWIG